MEGLIGRLIVAGGKASFHPLSNAEVCIVDPVFQERLAAAAPCYVGGPHLYDGPCELTAALELIDGALSIITVTSGRYQVDGTWYEF